MIVNTTHLDVMFSQLKEDFLHVFFITRQALHCDYHPHRDLFHHFAKQTFHQEIKVKGVFELCNYTSGIP